MALKNQGAVVRPCHASVLCRQTLARVRSACAPAAPVSPNQTGQSPSAPGLVRIESKPANSAENDPADGKLSGQDARKPDDRTEGRALFVVAFVGSAAVGEALWKLASSMSDWPAFTEFLHRMQALI